MTGTEYIPKTEDVLNQLAKDIVAGQVYTDRHLPDEEAAFMVFMPLALMGDEAMAKFAEQSPGMIYEHLDKAGPRSINGLPVFMSFQYLNVEDAKRVLQKCQKLDKAMKTALEGASD